MFVTELYARGWDVGFTLAKCFDDELFKLWERAVLAFGTTKAARKLRVNLELLRQEIGPFAYPLWVTQVLRRAGPCRPASQPMRNLELAKSLYGSRGGQARAKTAKRVDDALYSLYLAALKAHGQEQALQMMLWLISKDPEIPCVPAWLQELFTKHQALVLDGLVR